MMEMYCSVYDAYGLRVCCKDKPNLGVQTEIPTGFVGK